MSNLIPTKQTSLADDTDWKAQAEIPEEQTNLTLHELGMTDLNLKKIRGYKRIAEMLKTVGLVEYERGRLMGREHALEAAITAMATLAVHDGNKDTRISASMALKELVTAANKAAELNIRLEEMARQTAQEKKTTEGLPPIGVAVGQIVVHQAPQNVEKPANPTILDTAN